MKMLHKVWKKLIWVWNKCQGYEKSAWWYETNDKCSETNTHLKDAHIVLLTDFFRTVFVWCGFVLYLSGRYLCGVGLFCTICTVFKSIHIQLEPHSTFFTTKTGRKLYCVPIIADHKWNCFVLLKLFLYHNQTVFRISCSRVHTCPKRVWNKCPHLSYWARDSKDLGFRSQRRGVA